ncbi:hypothetical protein TcCL_Unassigned03661 [Trypanosoma cruzi]|nr:hypothetical protein TcCL_Unassigned03661 [Trypanosoma cruzi]
MAASQGGPDAVHDTQEPRQTTWQRYDRQPSSASKRCWCWWCVSKAESSPAPSSQCLVPRSRESALHSRQRHHARTTHTRREQRSTAAALGHGEKGPCRLHSDWLTDVRMVVVQMPRGCCDCSGLRG